MIETIEQRAVDTVVSVRDLRVRYGATVAVDGISLNIRRGEIFGILGPNGAGKTTTVECIGGLRTPDQGTISVLGVDPRRDRDELRQRVGIQLQSSGLPDKLAVGEALELFAAFYDDPADPDELMTLLGLTEKRDTRFAKLSGGQKQRLSIALALIGRPQVAILDELTTGLDPQARRETWKLIESVRDSGVTVLLVTHFMEEAERLCDRVALIDSGRIVALDTPVALAARAMGAKSVRFVPSTPFDESVLTRLPEVTAIEHDGHHIVVTGTGELATAVIVAMHTAGVETHDVRIDASTLEDAFVRLTGNHLHEAAEGAQP
jgi:ABC-2 type transport system ATP-binding protein